jgi:hypothetical protein
MSAESALTAVAIVRALLHGDIEGPTVLLPDGCPGPAAASWWPARPSCRPGSPPAAEGSTWTGSSGSGRTARGDAELVMAVQPWEASVTSAAGGPSASCGVTLTRIISWNRARRHAGYSLSAATAMSQGTTT